jgi:O-methyltransferase
MSSVKPIPLFRPNIQLQVPEHYGAILERYKPYSMVADNPGLFCENLLLMDFIGQNVNGDFVECGTWKGGMSCAMMAVGGSSRQYHFFDSFEGLPDAQDIDGPLALQYQLNTDSPLYHDNCRADYDEFLQLIYAQEVPRANIHVYKGWFEQTLLQYPESPIAVLRLDGDWYESTMNCLQHLFAHVVEGGIVVLDDYDAWDGCARATHDFLSQRQLNYRISRTPLSNIAYIQKR